MAREEDAGEFGTKRKGLWMVRPCTNRRSACGEGLNRLEKLANRGTDDRNQGQCALI